MPKMTSARVVAAAVALAMVCVAGQAAFFAPGNVYVVQPGDSLWAISRRAGVSMQALAQVNNMRLSDVLVIGRHLTVPGAASSTSPSAAPAPAAGVSAAGASTSSGYTGADFCASFSPTSGPRGVLPWALTASSSRLGLRPLFVRWGQAYGVQPALLEAIAWQESGWQQGVVSSAQAVGIGQLLPVTADFVSSELIGLPLDINSTSDNIRMMARFVSYLQTQERGTCRVIASYYEGTQNMARYGVFAETRPYVANVEYLLPSFE